MLADCHMHSEFSTDSDAPMESMCDAAIARGIQKICITDHYDMDYSTGEFQLDTDRYEQKVREVQKKYAGRLVIGFGVELGLMPQLGDRIREYADSRSFDFVIGSVHVIDGTDPYYRSEIPCSDEEMYRRYFAYTLKCLDSCDGFQTLGHLDYAVRYGYDPTVYSYRKYSDLIDEILRKLIDRGIALEVNAAGLRYGLGYPNPHPDVIRHYRELGGEMVTIGADAHEPDHVGSRFEEIRDLLLDCGFRWQTVFSEKRPEMLPLR